MEFWAETGSDAYVHVLSSLLRNGKQVSPRGEPTLEMLNATITVEDAATAHTLRTVRPANLRISATETLHLLGGLSSLEQLDLASGGRFQAYADRGRLRGAYGPRIYHQVPAVLSLLARDPDTRQAVITIWNGKEHQVQSRDVPCTQSFQFFVRNGRLDMRAGMRSSDAWLGIPHDYLMFSRLQLVMAHCLGLEAGHFTHTAGSLHLYERDREAAQAVVDAGVLDRDRLLPPPPLIAFEDAEDLPPIVAFAACRRLAEVTCTRTSEPLGTEITERPFRWYHRHVPMIDGVICEDCRYVIPVKEMGPFEGRCHECSF